MLLLFAFVEHGHDEAKWKYIELAERHFDRTDDSDLEVAPLR